MTRRLLMALVIGLLFGSSVFSQTIPPPKLDPTPTSDRHKAILSEAVALHNHRQFDAAIAKYQQVLQENPNDVTALYELGYSYFEKGDYMKSLRTAYNGAQYKSQELAGFYLLMGNNLDKLDEPENAIKVYKTGMKLFPANGLFHFNLAITYLNIEKSDDAKKSLKRAAELEPEHPATHLGLGQLYLTGGYKVPAVLALSRFLVLEPDTNRSSAALQTMEGIIRSGIGPPTDSRISVVIEPKGKTDEGDFDTVSLALSMIAASPHLEKNRGKSEMQLVVEDFSTLFSVIEEVSAGKKHSGFAWNYYRPYFVEMKSRDYVEPFCYYTRRSGNNKDVARWLSENAGRVNEFLNWSKGYQWKSIEARK
jgi:tetratricopeptide (TPR) repeat protein